MTPSKFTDQIKSIKNYKIFKKFKMLANFILPVKSLWIYYESSIHTTSSCSVFLTVVMTQQAEKGIQIHDQPIKHMLGLWLGARPADIFWTFYHPMPSALVCSQQSKELQWNCVIGPLHVMSTVTNLINSSFCVYDTIQPCCGRKTHTHTLHM